MTERHLQPYPATRLAARTAVVAAAMLLGAPALANTVSDKACPKREQATLTVAVTELSASEVSHDVTVATSVGEEASPGLGDIGLEKISRTGLLAPRAEAAIREVFSDETFSDSESAAVNAELIKTVLRAPMAGTDAKTDAPADNDTSADPQPDLKTQLPGVTDDELSYFKKQMFRRDI